MSFNDAEMVKIIPNLKKFAMKLCRNEANGDDLLQDTVLRMMEKRDLFAEGSNLWGWASKIMFNIFASRFRRTVKFESQYDPEAEILAMSVEAVQENNLYAKQVRAAVQALPPDAREIINVVVDTGTYEGAAERLNIPLGTVRSRLCRARTQLEGNMNRLRIADTGVSSGTVA